MYQTATITTKRQLTIPAKMYKRMGLKSGQKVILTLDNDTINIESASQLVSRLAGSIDVPQKFANAAIDTIVQTAKQEYVKERQKKSSL